VLFEHINWNAGHYFTYLLFTWKDFIYFAAMLKKTRLIIICYLFVNLMFSCIKKTDRKVLEADLKTAMELSLNHQPKVDTSLVHFKVLEVSFFEGKKVFSCEFKVNMKQKMPDRLVDTIGYMSADISKDFKTVDRKY
jgi:hypothetical protein